MKTIWKVILIITTLVLIRSAKAQGTFQNLDFESANVAWYAPDTENVPIADALPGWSALYGNTPATEVGYDDISFGGAEVSVIDNKSPAFGPLEGTYCQVI
jgi:hypothetical protein